MDLEMISRVRRYQGQCRALQPLGHQDYRLRSYNKDPPLHNGYTDVATIARDCQKNQPPYRGREV